MPSYEPIKRDYQKDDLDMMEQAQVFHDTFVNDKADFIAAFPMFADPFAANFQTQITSADTLATDAEVVQAISIITEQIETKMELARKAMQKLFVYVKVAFNDSQAMLRAFGKGDYTKAYQSAMKMKELLEKANRQAEIAANKAVLIAAGYTQGDIDELEDIMEEIADKTAEQ